MNCGQCQELISVFLDGELDEAASAGIRDHLTLCTPCAKVCEDLAAILGSCTELDADAPGTVVDFNHVYGGAQDGAHRLHRHVAAIEQQLQRA